MRHPVCVSNSSAPGFNGLLESFKRRCLLSLLLPLPLFWKYIIPLTLYSRNGKSVQIALWSLSFYFNFGISTSFKEVGQTPLAWSQATSHTVNGRWWWCFLLTLLYSSWSPPCHVVTALPVPAKCAKDTPLASSETRAPRTSQAQHHPHY